MKQLGAIAFLFTLLLSTPGHAMYVDAVDVYQILNTADDTTANDSVSWFHYYDGSQDPIDSVVLTIVAEDVDPGEVIDVWFGGVLLGSLNDQGFLSFGGVDDIFAGSGCGDCVTSALSTTHFNIDPILLMNVTLSSAIQLGRLFSTEIETATLTVMRQVSIGEPQSLFLVLIGLIFFVLINQYTGYHRLTRCRQIQ